MNNSKFKLTSLLLLVFTFCLLSSCTEGLEDDDGIQCDNQTRLINITGEFIGMLSSSRPDFSMRVASSNEDCVKVGFSNQQGFISNFDGQIADDRIVLEDENEQNLERDLCDTYGETKTVIIATTGTILIHDDKDPIEIEFNAVKQTYSDKNNGDVLCVADFNGTLIKQ